MTTQIKILDEPLDVPVVGEIRKAVMVTTTSGRGWDATVRHSYYWTRKAANKAHPRLLTPPGTMMVLGVVASTIRVVWTGKCWNIVGQAVRPK